MVSGDGPTAGRVTDSPTNEKDIATMRNMCFAGLWPRFLALLVDFLLFCTIFFAVTRLVKGVWIMSAGGHRWNFGLFVTDPLCIAFLLVMVLYFVLLEGLTGVTLGKWIVGLRVERVGGGRPGLARGLMRTVLRLVDGLPVLNIVGIILIATSAERARFGDRVAGTRVVGK
jgi:uncharacterized RDD family membrane protein YckC